ncbi:hypothetical protein [Anaeroselena agilis]|uniref:Uncharacterized protein n=1 Tax=Anaeroselena agilis TaxID=3063788 RepID=A0ABU3P089_9FIRM|nr:hypothetical protein [Selenomonadales bacterium 4137-cl]
MINRKTVSILVLALFAAMLLAAPVCSAASQDLDKPTRMLLKVDVVDTNMFWSYPYISRDGKARVPAAIQVVWSTTSGLDSKTETMAVAKSDRGQVAITTEKDAFVDIEVQVVDAKKTILGKASLQVRNTGKDVAFVVNVPDITSPVIELQ